VRHWTLALFWYFKSKRPCKHNHKVLSRLISLSEDCGNQLIEFFITFSYRIFLRTHRLLITLSFLYTHEVSNIFVCRCNSCLLSRQKKSF
jgi:hypothetical protein